MLILLTRITKELHFLANLTVPPGGFFFQWTLTVVKTYFKKKRKVPVQVKIVSMRPCLRGMNWARPVI